MTRIFARSLLLASLLSGAAGGGAAEEIVVIAHPTLPKADRPTLLRLYTGRTVSIGMQSVTPLNLSAGNPLREKFLKDCLEQTEEQYTGYWLVRRYVGRGAAARTVERRRGAQVCSGQPGRHGVCAALQIAAQRQCGFPVLNRR
jgi:hypothetical protein